MAGEQELEVEGREPGEPGFVERLRANLRLGLGEELMLHTGSGADTASDLYWGASSPIWNNAGDTVIVRTPDGEIMIEEAYNG